MKLSTQRLVCEKQLQKEDAMTLFAQRILEAMEHLHRIGARYALEVVVPLLPIIYADMADSLSEQGRPETVILNALEEARTEYRKRHSFWG